MAGKTYTWIGGSGSASTSTNWSPTGHPGAGDTAIVNSGTASLDPDATLSANTVYLGNATFNLIGDFGSGTSTAPSLTHPTFDPATVILSAATAISAGTINATGLTANDGTILANGTAGSSLLLTIGTAVSNGTTIPGYFLNAGILAANAGNTLTIAVGPNAELLNSGSIIANGGTVIVTASPSAIAGGIAAEAAFFIIQNGGTLETQASYPLINGSQPGGTTPRYEFANATPGNTLKIDNLGSFSGSIIGFQAGDTIDLGTSLAVGTLVYSTTTGLLVLENSAGTILDSLYLSANAMISGTFAVSGNTADGIIITTGVNGDTLLTTNRTFPQASGTSGTWQSALSWNNGVIPGALDTAVIGLGATTAFTLTTGATPVSVNGIALYDPNATLDITSNTNTTPGLASIYAGTLEITAGNTLTASGLRSFSPSGSVHIQAGATVALTGRPNGNLASIGGTLAISQGNSSAAQFAAGTLVVDGALLAGPTPASNGGSFTIGSDSAGVPATVIVNGDGKATDGQVTDTYTLLGSDPTSSGTLILNGPNANWTDAIDPNDPLNSRGYILVGYNNLSSNAGTLARLGAVAPAHVLIENGATLTDQAGGYIGDTTNSAGEVTVQSGGVWNLSSAARGGAGFIAVGQSGDGTLSVLAGGSVAIGSIGTFMSNGTAFTGGGMGIGQAAGSTGTVIVSGTGARLSTLNGIGVGKSGQGQLTILNGGTVAVTGGNIGVGTTPSASSSGTIVVGGSGAAAALNVGPAAVGLTIGSASQGTLIVADNGTINLSGTGGLTVGALAGAYGTSFVGGTLASAVINIGTAGMTVGSSGTGVLTVGNHGTIALTGTSGIAVGQNFGAIGNLTIDGGIVTEGTATGGVGLGSNAGANGSILIENAGTLALGGNWLSAGIGGAGTVTVTGSGSVLKTTGTAGLTIGLSAAGALGVTNGGVVNDISSLSIGQNAAATGLVSVDASTLTAASIFVGQSGNGTLAITSGTVAASGLLDIGFNIGSSGRVTVAGPGAKLIASGGIEVGGAGSGTLAVQGATVATTGNLSLGGSFNAPQSTATNLASLTAGTVMDVSGSLAIWHGATIALDNTSGIDIGTSGSILAGAINVEGTHTLIGNGLIAAAVLNNGLIQTVGSTAPNSFGQVNLEIQGPVTGHGTIVLANNGIIQFDSTIASTQAIQFNPNSASELILNSPGSSFDNAITGLAVGDRIDFGGGMTITSASIVNGNTISILSHGTTYNLTNVGFAPGATPTLSWGTDFANGDADIQLQAPNASWQGGTGTAYGTAANWQGGSVPNAATAVSFVNNPGTITGTGSALSLTIGNYNAFNPGPWTFQGTTLTVAGAANPPFLPFGVAFNANTVLNGGTLNAAGGTASIGNSSNVTVTAQGGVQVTTLGDSIGSNAGQSGSLVLTGAGTGWTDAAGTAINGNQPGFTNVGFNSGSSGNLTVTNNASLTTGGYANVAGGTGSFGTATIAAGGAWTIGQGLQVGAGGIGTLTISGGTVKASGYNAIGGNTGGQGTVAITAGLFNTGTALSVGASGTGTLIATGGTVTTGQLTLGSVLGGSGVLSLSNGTIAATNGMQIGASGGGVATIAAGGTLRFGGTYNPIGGNAGSSGSLLILNGGTALATQAPGTANVLQIGNSGTSATQGASDGTVVVSGAGALLNLGTNGITVGNQGVGILTVAQGGVVDAGVTNSNLGGALSAANSAGGIASIIVTGTGSALNLGGYVSLGQAGEASLTVSNGGLVAITNAATNGTGLSLGAGFTSPANIGGQAQATVTSGGTLSDAGRITIGGNGASGVLNVNTGGVVTTATGLTVGIATQANGTIYGGTGALNIGAGGTVSATGVPQPNGIAVQIGSTTTSVSGTATQASGVVVVTGTGALLTTNDNPLVIGGQANGILTVSHAGSVAVGTANTDLVPALAVGQYAEGSLVLTDTGSRLTMDGGGYIGRAGVGTGLIENHASLIVNADTGNSDSNGFSIGSASAQNNTTQTSVQTGGSGDLQVTTFGGLYSQGTITVGRGGATGTLKVDTGGTVEAVQQVAIGTSVTVAAGGTIITSSGTSIVSGGSVLGGDGSVIVGAGGLLKADGSGLAGTPDIIVGWSTLAAGVLNVTGTGATVDTGGHQLAVGLEGTGSLLISQRGTVLAGTPFARDEAIFAGGSAGATGAITLMDPGSELLAKGQLSVGLGGQGSLLIKNHATAITGGNTIDAAQGFEIGQLATGSGDATVSNALLSNTGRFIVGDAGLGSLAITAGGTVTTSAGATIANTTGADGSSVNVTGSGSSLQVAGALAVGNAGAGALSLSAGASVTADTLDAGVLADSSGIVTLSGTHTALTTIGTLSIGDGGIGELSVLNGATLSIGGDFNVGQVPGGAGNVDVEGTSTLIVGGNLNMGAGGPAEITVGPNATFMLENGVLNGTPGNATLTLFTIIDPLASNGITQNIKASGVQSYTAFVTNSPFNLAPGINYTLDTPVISGTATFTIGGPNTTLVLNADTVSSGTTIAFTDATGKLVLGHDELTSVSVANGKGGFTSVANPHLGDALIGGFSGVISGFTAGDQLVVQTDAAATFTQAGSVVSVIENGVTLGALTFATTAGAEAAAAGGLVDQVLCFLPDTLIATPDGEVKVQALQVGDLVRTASGADRPVAWIGQGRVLAPPGSRGGRRTAATPVIVRRHALAHNVPHYDLHVTKGHALFIDDVLIPVEFLVNHRSILWDDQAREVSLYHVELDTHDVLLANGAPAESYRDDGNRWLFQNANSGWGQPEKPPCAPVLTGGPVVDAVWQRLLERSGPRPGLPLTEDADVHLLVDGVRVDGARAGDRCVFRLRRVGRDVRLVSRAASPAELGLARDPRVLGVAVRRLELWQGPKVAVIEADDARLADGFHGFEPDGGIRWTDGDAGLPVDGVSGAVELVVHLGGTTTRYAVWDAAA